MKIGENLRKLRDKKEITQQEMADYLGIDRRTYVDWEEGKTEIKGSFFPKLAEILQVEVGDFFPKKSGDIVISQNNSDNKDDSINGVVFLLTDKEAIDQLVDVMKKKFGVKK